MIIEILKYIDLYETFSAIWKVLSLQCNLKLYGSWLNFPIVASKADYQDNDCICLPIFYRQIELINIIMRFDKKALSSCIFPIYCFIKKFSSILKNNSNYSSLPIYNKKAPAISRSFFQLG